MAIGDAEVRPGSSRKKSADFVSIPLWKGGLTCGCVELIAKNDTNLQTVCLIAIEVASKVKMYYRIAKNSFLEKECLDVDHCIYHEMYDTAVQIGF